MQLDTLVIDVSANTSKATKNIQNLTSKIRALRSVFNGINQGSDSLQPLYEGLKDIASLDFSKSIEGLTQVSSILKSLESTKLKDINIGINGDKTPQLSQDVGMSSGSISPLSGGETSSALSGLKAQYQELEKYAIELEEHFQDFYDRNMVEDYCLSLSAVTKEMGFISNQIKEIETQELDAKLALTDGEIDNALSQIKAETAQIASESLPQVQSALEKIGLSSVQLEQVNNAIGKMEEDFAKVQPEQFDSVRNALQEMGYTADQVSSIMKKLGDKTEESGDKADKSTSKFGKFMKSLKRIMMYRAIRRALQIIVNALKEGITNVASFDANTSNAINKLKASTSYLKDSLGAMLAPLIQFITPALTAVTDAVGDLANNFAEFFAVMNGQSTFTKAIKSADEYAESLEKAKSVSLGIDELNVISQDNGSGGNFEVAEVGKEASKYAGTLQSFAKTLKKIAKDVFDLVSRIVKAIMPAVPLIFKIADILLPVFEMAIKVVNILIPLLPSIINLVESLMPLLTLAVQVVDVVVTILTPLLNFIVTVVSGVIDLVSKFNNEIMGFWATFGKFLKAIFEGNFAEAGKLGKKLCQDFINFWIAGFEAVLNFVIDAINSLTSGLSSLWEWIGIPAIPAIPHVEFPRVAFAEGGFPEDGLFFANHNELVGKFANGKTAVANNEQIIEGIKQGVIEALEVSGGNGANIAVYLDSEEIASRVEQNANRKTAKIFKGAYGYGK